MQRIIAALLTAGGFLGASLLAIPVAWAADVFTLTSSAVQDNGTLQPGMTREELADALKDHVKGSAGLITRFKHPS
jgi:hypothetical protein